MISMVWAMDENRLIGQGERLPWHLPNDLRHFKEVVGQTPVLMGDATYRSLKGYYRNRPLPFSQSYVANLDDAIYEDAIRVEDLIRFLRSRKDDLIIIGGKTIYTLALPYAKRLYVTYVLGVYEGNVHFPAFDLSQFRLMNSTYDDKLIFATYERVTTI